MHETSACKRLITLVLAATLGCFCLLASSAYAGYGGLGHLGSIQPGEEQKHVEVASAHGFVVNPADGSYFIADQTKKGVIRVQKFGEKGEFLAEGPVTATLAPGASVGGLAIDPEKKRVYLLVDAPRPGERNEAVVNKLNEEIEKLEAKAGALETARTANEEKAAKYKKEIEEKKPNQKELEEKLKSTEEKIAGETAEIKKDEEAEEKKREEIPPFDAEAPAAAALLAFSTEATGTTLPAAAGTSNGVVVEEKELLPSFEGEHEDTVPLLEPRGIAVDAKTHDVVIVGQQDVATPPPHGAVEPEDLRAAVQRVHAEAAAGKRIGPRYVDQENCLDGAFGSREPACAAYEAPISSPVVLPNGSAAGRVVAVREGAQGELWEVPATSGESEGFGSTSLAKRYATEPKQVYELTDLTEVVNFGNLGSASEQGDTMAYTPLGAGHGRIELAARVSPFGGKGSSPAVLLLGYEEAVHPQISELGWTGGANVTSGKPACTVPAGASSPVLVGGDAKERTLVFNSITPPDPEPRVSVLAFGNGGEQCGSAEASPLTVQVAGVAVEAVRLGGEATITGSVKGADALSTEWRIKNLTTGKEEAPVTTGFQEQQPTLLHKFSEPGRYKITAVVTPDDFQGPLAATSAEVSVGEASLTATASGTTAVATGAPARFTAHVKDPYEPHATALTYQWEYGDGRIETTKGGLEDSVEHTYAAPCSCTVHVKVTDGSSHSVTASTTIVVSAPSSPPPPSPPPPPPPPPPSTTPTGPTQPPGQGVLPFAEARLASSAVTVNKSGALSLSVFCLTGAESCSGTVTLRTLSAVLTSSGHGKKKKQILQVASGSFSLATGQTAKLTLHLSPAGRALLAKTHTLRVSVTVLARSPKGNAKQTQAVLTLKLAPAKKKKKH